MSATPTLGGRPRACSARPFHIFAGDPGYEEDKREDRETQEPLIRPEGNKKVSGEVARPIFYAPRRKPDSW